MRGHFLYIAIFLSLKIAGQAPPLNDTIKIKEVVISSRPLPETPAGFKSENIDSLAVAGNYINNLADLLSYSSNLYIKSYGPGGIATPSFRGTSASHTKVSWNGINITNPMLGQSDLSTIPSGIFENIKINYGTASSDGITAGIGGSIDLENKPDWKSGTDLYVSGKAGSFGDYSGMVKATTGTSVFQSVTKAYLVSSDNDFTYLNKYLGTGPVIQSRTNSNANIRGLLQEVFLKKNWYSLSARAWYQSALRNLPQPVIAIDNSGEHQFDESLRTMVDLKSDKSGNDLYITAAGMYSRLNYFNRSSQIDSRNSSTNFIVRSGFSLQSFQFSKIRFSFENDLGAVHSNNYARPVRRNISSIAMIVESRSGRLLEYSVLIRGKADGKKILVPDFAAGAQLRVIPGTDNYLSASVSGNSRLPSMNELYWNPGGNMMLKNEHANVYEIGYKASDYYGKGITLSSGANIFFNDIKDMIFWHPGNSTFWIPENLKNINSYGVESDLIFGYKGNNSKTEARISYTFTRSVQANPENEDLVGKQLLYIPVNQASGHLNYTHGNFYSALQFTYAGKRFVSADNADFLPGYSVINLLNGYKIKTGAGMVDLNFRIENILGTYYETIAYYPQPGRTFYITIIYNYTNR